MRASLIRGGVIATVVLVGCVQAKVAPPIEVEGRDSGRPSTFGVLAKGGIPGKPSENPPSGTNGQTVVLTFDENGFIDKPPNTISIKKQTYLRNAGTNDAYASVCVAGQCCMQHFDPEGRCPVGETVGPITWCNLEWRQTNYLSISFEEGGGTYAEILITR